MNKLSAFFTKNRKFLPLSATILLFILAYAFGAISYEGMRDPQVLISLFIITPFLLISAVGETFVVISGGIDLSVSGVVALTATASAALLHAGWNPWLVMGLMLIMGMAIGAVMGGFISFMKVQPFIATLAGMWFARGMCYIISDSEIRIYDPLYKLLAGTKILIPGFADPVTQKGLFVTPLVVLSVSVFLIALFIAHYTRFGRTVYAIGGNNGANEQAAKLMGLPVDRTKMMVYVFNGLCSALAGIAYSIYVGSGHGTHATGFEMTVIASVVIGGIMLTGGEGYLFGTVFGVLITALIQTLIQFNGRLSSWWTSIAVGVLTLVFIGVQSLLSQWNARSINIGRTGARDSDAGGKKFTPKRIALYGVTAVMVIMLIVVASPKIFGSQGQGTAAVTNTAAACERTALREEEALKYINEGAVITYERNGGLQCIDELFAIYADGRVIGDNGETKLEKQVTPEQVTKLLENINRLGWFTDDMYSTYHKPCDQCFTYLTTVSYQGQQKTIKAVDGGTDAPADYWVMSGAVSILLPQFTVEK